MRSSPRGQTLERPGPAEPRTPQTAPFGSFRSRVLSLRTLPRAFPGGPVYRGGLGSVCKHLQLPGLALRISVKAPGQASVSFLPSFPSGCLPSGVTFSCLSFLAVSVSFIHPFLHSSKKLSLSTSKGEHCLQEYRPLPWFTFERRYKFQLRC